MPESNQQGARQIRDALTAMRDQGDRPGFYEEASDALAALENLEEQTHAYRDSLSDEDRQMLKPYVTKVIGTRGTKRQEEKRAWLATDWLARECAPAFLRLAGLIEHAETLERLAALTTAKRATAAQPKLRAARDAAGDAAWDAAWDAAGDAARAALELTVKQLQTSALRLLDSMIEVGRKEPVAT